MSTLVSLLALLPGASGQPSALVPAQARRLAVRAERVLLADGAELAPGVILIEDARISAVGSEIEIPDGTLVIDHEGTASAGLVAIHTYSGMGWEVRDTTRTVLAEARAALAFDRGSPEFEDALSAGITSVALAPAPTSLCGGTGALVKTARGEVVVKDAFLSLGFSAQSLRNDRYPTSFGGAIAELDRRFEDPEGAFARAARKDLPVLFEVTSREDVARAVEFAARHELTGAVHGAPWTGELADQVKAAGLAVVCGPLQVGEDRRALLAILALAKAGVPFGFGLDAPLNHPAMLRGGAAMCVREGLDRKAAWRALTSDAAKIAGAEGRVGTLAKDADADLVLWSGDPLDLASAVEAVYVGGALVWESKQ